MPSSPTVAQTFAPLTLLLALAGGCSGGGDPAEAPKPPPPAAEEPVAEAQRDTLVVAVIADLGSLNPVVYESASDAYVIGALAYPAVTPGFDCSLTTSPGLASEWSWNEAGDVLSMTLRDDIKWSDGVPVTARDIAFTYDLIADPKVASPRLASVARLKEGHRPKVIDDTHLEWHFTTAYDRDSQIAHINMGPVPAHVFQNADRATLRGHPANLQPVVAGPWRLAKHEPNQRYVIEPNPDFTGPAELVPQLKRVVFRVLPEYTTRLTELKNGAVDMMDSIEVEDADPLRKEHPEIRIVRRGWRSSDYIAWNLSNPLFSSLEVRQALTLAVDVEDMIGKLLTGADGEAYARPAIGTITPELCNVHNDEVQRLPHDPAKAKELLAAQGWTDSNGDGWLDKGGQTFEFTLTTNAGNARRASASIFVQAYLKEVGVKVNLERVESNTFFANLRQRKFEAALAGWEAALFADPSPMWKSDAGGKQEFNFTGYANAEVDALIEKGLSEPDPTKAAVYWKELQAIVYNDQPYLFLWWRDELVAIHERFENTNINALSRLDTLHDWSVPAEKVKYER
jgi:peptide/nickel transport system substrate-binding protein